MSYWSGVITPTAYSSDKTIHAKNGGAYYQPCHRMVGLKSTSESIIDKAQAQLSNVL